MNDSMAQAGSAGIPLEVPRWRTLVGWTSAVVVALLFYLSGLWKITDPEGAAVRMAQALVPERLSLAAAISFGIVETIAATMLLVPRLRRWGAATTALLLVAFLAWFAINYNALHGAECSCFPWLKRAVGPGFFIGDGVMLALALAAGAFAPRPRGFRAVALITGAVTVFAMVSWGVATVRQTGTRAPDTISVEGQPYSLRQGKVFLYFFDPQCMHCFEAARKMSTHRWKDTRIVGVPTSTPQYAAGFMEDTHFKMAITSDHAKLKQIFPYTAAPAGVALENGRQIAALTRFQDEEPEKTLRELKLID
jgi:uncharacterized membrane protein YphA (DoxX/SURF4 family)